MKVIKGPGRDGVILEESDFEYAIDAALKLRGKHLSMVFIPEHLSDLYERTELWRLLLPSLSVNGYVYCDVYLYSNSKSLRNCNG